MNVKINGAPAFCYIEVLLEPGESIIAEADAMSSMSADIGMETRWNGGFFSALMKKFLGGESLFVNVFTNSAQSPQSIVLVQPTPGQIRQRDMNGDAICLQPGSYICATPGLHPGVKWAGIASFIGGEGLFKLQISGQGTLWYGAYGGLVDKEVDGAYIVDSSHLVAYAPHLKLKAQLAGGIFSSFFGGEGLVTRVEGKGRITIQSRSLSGLAGWINHRL